MVSSKNILNRIRGGSSQMTPHQSAQKIIDIIDALPMPKDSDLEIRAIAESMLDVKEDIEETVARFREAQGDLL